MPGPLLPYYQFLRKEGIDVMDPSLHALVGPGSNSRIVYCSPSSSTVLWVLTGDPVRSKIVIVEAERELGRKITCYYLSHMYLDTASSILVIKGGAESFFRKQQTKRSKNCWIVHSGLGLQLKTQRLRVWFTIVPPWQGLDLIIHEVPSSSAFYY